MLQKTLRPISPDNALLRRPTSDDEEDTLEQLEGTDSDNL